MAPINQHSLQRPPRGPEAAAGYNLPTRPKAAPSSADSRPSLPTVLREAGAESVVTVVAPSEPPQLTPDAAKVLLRILLQAGAQDPDASGSKPGGGRTSAAPVHRLGQRSRRAS